MKRTITALVAAGLFAAVAATVFAAPATQAYRSGAIVAQGGIGFGVPGVSGTTTIPPIIASVEYELQVTPQLPLSFGGVFGYTGSKYTVNDPFGDTFNWTYSDIIVGARVAYHLQKLIKVPKLDTYAGIMLGYDIVNVTATSSGPYASLYSGTYTPSVSGLIYGAYVGARYFFTPLIGIYGELGYNLGYFNLGATFKF